MSKLMTSLRLIDGGDVIKSGDTSSEFTFEILDDDGNVFPLTGEGIVTLSQLGEIKFSKNVKVVDGVVTFTLGKSLEYGKYLLEIKVDGHIFPSNKYKVKVVQSSFGGDTLIPPDVYEEKLRVIANDIKQAGLVDSGEDYLNIYNLAKI
jgi:phage protein|nr:MAG TPA: BppU domain protein [Caudoviricetes sp.]